MPFTVATVECRARHPAPRSRTASQLCRRMIRDTRLFPLPKLKNTGDGVSDKLVGLTHTELQAAGHPVAFPACGKSAKTTPEQHDLLLCFANFILTTTTQWRHQQQQRSFVQDTARFLYFTLFSAFGEEKTPVVMCGRVCEGTFMQISRELPDIFIHFQPFMFEERCGTISSLANSSTIRYSDTEQRHGPLSAYLSSRRRQASLEGLEEQAVLYDSDHHFVFRFVGVFQVQ